MCWEKLKWEDLSDKVHFKKNYLISRKMVPMNVKWKWEDGSNNFMKNTTMSSFDANIIRSGKVLKRIWYQWFFKILKARLIYMCWNYSFNESKLCHIFYLKTFVDAIVHPLRFSHKKFLSNYLCMTWIDQYSRKSTEQTLSFNKKSCNMKTLVLIYRVRWVLQNCLSAMVFKNVSKLGPPNPKIDDFR